MLLDNILPLFSVFPCPCEGVKVVTKERVLPPITLFVVERQVEIGAIFRRVWDKFFFYLLRPLIIAKEKDSVFKKDSSGRGE